MDALKNILFKYPIYDSGEIDDVFGNLGRETKKSLSTDGIVKESLTHPSSVDSKIYTLSSSNSLIRNKQYFSEWNGKIGGFMNEKLVLHGLSVAFSDSSKAPYELNMIQPKFHLEINGQLTSFDDPIVKRTFRITHLNGTEETYVGNECDDHAVFDSVSSFEVNGQVVQVKIGEDCVRQFNAKKSSVLEIQTEKVYEFLDYNRISVFFRHEKPMHTETISSTVTSSFADVSAYKINDNEVVNGDGSEYVENLSIGVENVVVLSAINDMEKEYDYSIQSRTFVLNMKDGTTTTFVRNWDDSGPDWETYEYYDVDTVQNKGNTYVIGYHQLSTFTNNVNCLIKGTRIRLFNGGFKNIEDISYEDDILTFNFDNGTLESSKPLWIQKVGKTSFYFEDTFKTGRKLFTTGEFGHRLFVPKRRMFAYDTDSIGMDVAALNGNDTLVSQEKHENADVEFYNVITFENMNLFANDILTSCRYNNLYRIRDMRFLKDGRELIPADAFSDIPTRYVEGMRLRETSNFNVNDTISYVKNLIECEREH